MGAWGAGAFENDDAMDWVANLEQSVDDALLTAALDDVIGADEGGYIDAIDAQIALAAAEVVAGAIGSPAADLPDEVTAWVADHRSAVRPELSERARRALSRIEARSELRALWDASDSREAWHSAVADLQGRLG